MRIILPGGAGLVGQNLVMRLRSCGYNDIIVLDKHKANLEILRSLHPDVTALYADLAEPGDWESQFDGADIVVMLQAQIAANLLETFIRNNVISTHNVLNAIKRYEVPYAVHISSSVLNSVARDAYTETKREQERLVLASGIQCVVLRPTLMFGLFDRKHFGWLSRFMRRVPIFPIPGSGRYPRQPLYVGDLCSIIVRCIESRVSGVAFNITGLEHVDYVDIVRHVKRAIGARCLIVHVPYRIFSGLLKLYALFCKSPPFTAAQLKALTEGDDFEVIDWESIFMVRATPFETAVRQTFNDPQYSHIVPKL